MNRTARTLAILVAVVATAPASSRGADERERYARPVEIPAFTDEELVAVPLDSDVYFATDDDYADLRLLNAADEETAFIIRKVVDERSRTERRTFSIERPTVRPQDDGSLEITFEVDPATQPHVPLGVRLVTPLENFERHVEISGSADGETWQPLLSDGLVFDYSEFMDVHNHELPFEQPAPTPTGAGVRRFRIRIDDVTQEQESQLLELTRRLQGDDEAGRTERTVVNRQPFRIDRIECWYEVEVPASAVERLQDYPLVDVRREVDAEAKATHIIVQSRRQPFTELTIAAADRNFSRAVHVEVPVDDLPSSAEVAWGRPIGSATLERFALRGLQRENLRISFPESRSTQLRLVIANADSPPLDVSTVTARGPVYEVAFLAQAGQSYRLTYGGGGLEVPNYDVAALHAALAEGYDPLSAPLGPQVAAPAAPRPGEPALTRLLNDPRLLGGLIAVLVAALGVGLYRATRRLDALPRDDGNS
jgi:hypothetical protein